MTLPYYEEDGITIYHGDCREILPEIGQVDLVLTDPPYGTNYDSTHKKYRHGINYGKVAWDSEPYNPSPVISMGKPTIMWGGNCFSARLPDSTAWAVWVKIVRQDADIRQSDCELAWTNCLGRNRVFSHLWIGAYRKSESGIPNYHPTQKPVQLMEWCITISKIDGVVCDPYMGSGTTLVAAKELGRQAIGIEIEEKYCEIAVERLAQGVLRL